MGRVCTICRHIHLPEINRRMAGGESLGVLSRHYGLTTSSLQRHRANCARLPAGGEITKAMSRDTVIAATLPSRDELGMAYGGLRAQLDAIVADARKAGSLAVALSGIDALRKNLDSVSRLAGHDKPDPPVVNITNIVSVNAVIDRLLVALDGKPDVRAHVALALADLDGASPSPSSLPKPLHLAASLSSAAEEVS